MWSYMRICSCTNLSPKTLLANLEFLLVIKDGHGQKGLRFVVLSALMSNKGQDNFGSWNLLQPQLTLYDVWIK